LIALILSWALLGGTPPAAPPAAPALQLAALAIAPAEGEGFRPQLRIGTVLEDPAIEDAVRSGLPLRIRLTAELWRDGFFNSLQGKEGVTATLYYQPLEERFAVRTVWSDRTEVRSFTSFAAARATLERSYSLELRPRRSGRYYYTATLELETLTLSDLAELERWLKGELQPAVSGDGSVPGAVGQGMKRLLIRVLRLPARRYDARSEWFRVG
jgi:hypothetical protein